MNKILSTLSLISLLILAIGVSSCRKQSQGSNGEKVQPVNVRVETVTPSRLVDAIQIAGTVKAIEDVAMSPEEGGVVKVWKVKKGQRVAKGDLIVLLVDDVIKAGYEAALAQYHMAKVNLDKQQKVFDEHGISELQFKNIQYSCDAAKANADLMKARWQRTQLRSPIAGVVDNTIPNEGELAPPGMPIARIVNTETIKIQAEVPEMYSGSIRVGTPAVITFDALADDTLKGTLTFVASTVSAVNRTLQVEIILSNPFQKLKPEMVAKVKLEREIKQNSILVSENIIQQVDRDRYIVYVEKNGTAEERRLKIGGRQGNTVEVLEGLTAGDRLIVTGYQKIINGSPVIVTQ